MSEQQQNRSDVLVTKLLEQNAMVKCLMLMGLFIGIATTSVLGYRWISGGAKVETQALVPAPMPFPFPSGVPTSTTPAVYFPQQGGQTAPGIQALPAPSQPVSWSFIIAGAGSNRSGKKFFNSERDYKSPTCKTIVLDGPAFNGVDPRSFIGHGVSVVGTPTTYNGQQQMIVVDPSKVSMQ